MNENIHHGENPSWPRRRLGAFVLVALAGIALGVAVTFLLLSGRPAPAKNEGNGHNHPPVTQAAKQLYQCPMHPTIIQDHPGDCPICGMKLVPMEAAAATPAQTAAAESREKKPRKLLYYRNPMGQPDTSPVPKKDSMGMDYIPVYEDEVDGSAPAEGLAVVKIDPDRQQLIGLKTVAAKQGSVGSVWRTNGRLAVDETRIHHLNVKFSGFVETVHAGFIGRFVQRGEPLFSIYSPELLVAQQEFVLALSARGLPGNDDLVAASRRRLQLWDISSADIARLEKTRKAERVITIRAPATGVVVKKDVVPGMKVEAGAMPYEIVDLSSLWVLADVYETELAQVKVGMPATLTLKGVPGKTYEGKVAFIDPFLDPKSRTAKLRLSFANTDGSLKPEMFGEVVLKTPQRQGLRIPTDAVIDSGTQSVVFVALGNGKFEPRQVQRGATDGDQVEILSGLKEGEQVVTRANFLIDSESRLKASLQAMSGGKK
ncbi:MAG: efflux transporter, family, subunit [Proteobacteria bacterium]|nr:efflux transporter, family, subunit [Pseudomonadota bacterium]